MAKKNSSPRESNPRLVRVRSLAQYIETVQDIAASEEGSIWLRGHSNATYRLLPSALRETIPVVGPLGHPLRGDESIRASGTVSTGPSPERILDDFKRRALPFVEVLPRNDFEWLFLMQHHGAPTRLLDWTTNALVALYFAVERIQDAYSRTEGPGEQLNEGHDEFDNGSAAVFVMNPRALNKAFHTNIADPVDIAANYAHWEPYSRPMDIPTQNFDTYGPVCIVAPHVSPRIRAQSGQFTLHGTNLDPIDYYNDARPLLTKVLIAFGDAVRVRSELSTVGITPSFIFPGLDGVAKEVRENESRVFAWERSRYLQQLASNRASAHRRGAKR
jgi:hypothetical protein